MRKAFVAFLLLAVSAGLAPAAHAQESVSGNEPVIKPLGASNRAGSSVFGTANSNCVATTCDTVWIGHSNSGPGGAFLGVSVGGLWDWDAGTAGTDSTQGWQRRSLNYNRSIALPAASRPEVAIDWGNAINEGNTNLWAARDIAGRKYIKTGIAGAWHSSTLSGVKKKLNDGAEPSALPIAGTRSAWCGLRESGNQQDVDALTGNYINGDLDEQIGTPSSTNPDFPGYVNQWDQMLYKDFASSGTGSLTFKVRTDMSTFVDPNTPDGTGWFNPDPTNPTANFVINPADSFMVYVGSPTEAAYDTNRRWLSEVVNVASPLQEVFAVSGLYPYVNADTSITRAYSGLTPVSGAVRVVFRVKTNRVRSDCAVGTTTAFNSKQGAAVIDDVQVDGGTTYGFESASDVTARSLAGNLLTGAKWATTGKPPANFFHPANVATLLYEDLCGAVGSPTRRCNLAGNVMTPGRANNDGYIEVEYRQIIETPTIDLSNRLSAPGTKNTQGIDQETASRTSAVLDYDIYSGFMSREHGIFWQFGARYFAPDCIQPQSGNKCWSPWQIYGFIIFQPDPFCIRDLENLSSLGVPVGSMDSLKVMLSSYSQGWRFGGTDLGNTRGTYFDNARLGLVRGGDAPPLSQEIWNKYQDQFPVNEAVPPGDNASFDTTTAWVKSGLNTVDPPTAPGDVPGDSILANSPFTGNGVSSGVRMDLIFRIDPGPGNYSTKGNRASALVEKDPVHPFWASYKASNGIYGTPGGHGTFWNKDVWNSCRMDSADVNLYPVISRNIGGPRSPIWAGTIHEQDPKFATLGINHPVCFLVNPAGSNDESNTQCDGTVPVAYTGGVSGTSKEDTKIIPDGYLTPGSHVEYFVRRSLLENPAQVNLLFDTTAVFPQDAGGNEDDDAERWSSFDVLPDMWKSTRYPPGAGLACMLIIDDDDRRGSDPSLRGAADSLGYGKNNGATQGWKSLGPQASTEDPAGFVAANLGQYGLNFDHYDIRASESGEGGHPGSRFAVNTGGQSLKGEMAGPSAAQLASLYTTVYHNSGELNGLSTIFDGVDPQEAADDIALYSGFLAGATASNRRGMWLSGQGIMSDGALLSDDGTHLYPFLTDLFGSDLTADNYKARSGSAATTVGFLPVAPWAHPGRVYGFRHSCLQVDDVLKVVVTVDGAAEAAQYEHLGPSPWTSSVYRPTSGTRDFRTLIDGFDPPELRGNYASLGQIATLPGTDLGRISWFDDVTTNHFQICARRGPVIGVGDLPGVEGGRFSNANLGSFPNPAFAGRNITLRFTLAKAQDVTIRVYNVAGREVANFTRKAVEGPNNIVWNGELSNGAKATPGVYFYAVDGIDFVKNSKAQKMILLGSNVAE